MLRNATSARPSRFVALLIPALVVLGLCAQDARAANRIFIAEAMFMPLETGISIPVRIENDVAISGFQVAIDFDPAALSVLAVAADPALAAADFSQGSINGTTGRIKWGLVLDFEQGASIPPSANQGGLVLTADVEAATNLDTTLAFRDDRTVLPNELNLLSTTTGFPVAGLTTQNGVIHFFQDPNTPAAPSCLLTRAVSFDQVSFFWTDNSDNETGFEVQRRPEGATEFSTIDTVGPDATEFTDMSPTAGLPAEYRVRAVNDTGGSAFSNILEETPKTFNLIKGAAKLGKTSWTFAGQTAFDPGPEPYTGDATEIRVVLDGIEYFTPATTPIYKIKIDKKTGNVSKISGKNAAKDKITIDLVKKQVKIAMKSIAAEDLDPAAGVTNLRLAFGDLFADLALETDPAKTTATKALFVPGQTGELAPTPESNVCP